MPLVLPTGQDYRSGVYPVRSLPHCLSRGPEWQEDGQRHAPTCAPKTEAFVLTPLAPARETEMPDWHPTSQKESRWRNYEPSSYASARRMKDGIGRTWKTARLAKRMGNVPTISGHEMFMGQSADRSRVLQENEINLSLDGNQVCALVGPDLVALIAGFPRRFPPTLFGKVSGSKSRTARIGM
jgi:hypothetical protein